MRAGATAPALRLWKWELQQLANRTGLAITVCHFPPGTSKWNKIEHRLFSHIAMNWRGTPLVDLATIVSLIGSTHSRSGLRVRSELDRGRYPGGVDRHRRATGHASASSGIAFTATGTTRSTRRRAATSISYFLTAPKRINGPERSATIKFAVDSTHLRTDSLVQTPFR